MRNRLVVTLVLALAAALLAGPFAPVAAAAPAAPTGLAPNASSVASTPVLSWAAVPSATSYRVEISRSATFDILAIPAITTVNRQATPTTTLPSGELYWRVRAGDSAGAVSAWSNASFTLNAKAPPVQLTPADLEQLSQPTEPPVLTWKPVNGATLYELTVGTDPNLSTFTTYSTKTTSYAFTTPQAQATYYWSIRAVLGSGQATQWSGIHSYGVLPLAQPGIVAPDNSPDTVVADVVLEWTDVLGASKYEVRVSTDQNFTSVIAQGTSVATRWSPPVTLNNDQYWWQVRAYDSQNQTRDWLDPDAGVQKWQFERRWQFGPTTVLDPERPELVYPSNAVAPVTGDPFFYEWEPVRMASDYKLQVGTDQNFSPLTFKECTTKQTTLIPAVGEMASGPLGCKPSSGGTYYWRVQAVDETQGVLTPWSDIHAFTYRAGSVAFKAPANGATVAVPTMTWHQSAGAERYKLTYSYGTASPKTVYTYSNSYTPTGKIPDATPTVTWVVQAVYANNDESALPLEGSRSFTIGTPPATAPAPDAVAADPAGDRFPSLSWKPVAGAAYYTVYVGTAGTGIFQQLPDRFAYSAGTDLTKTHLGSKNYDWFVRAYSASNVNLGSGASGTFTIHDLGSVAGQGVAHTGTELDTTLRCSLPLSGGTAADVCPVRQTPVLDWDPVVGASSYQVYLARDESLTNTVYSVPVTTHNTRWTPTELLPDSQAGQAYYWVVRPCKAAGVCSPDPTAATNAFDKTSHRVEVITPTDGSTVADAVTFSWQDYLVTNSVPTGNGKSRVEAKQYKVDVSVSPTFQTILDTATVDQTTYTAPTRIYPEGPLFWRVSAIDGSGNTVGTSNALDATKQSDSVLLRSPASASTSPSTPALSWEPRAFTASYDIEVYKDRDLNFSAVNRVVSVNTKLSAYSLTTPLAAAPLPYVWRVRARDVSGNAGPWSDPRTFTIAGAAPTQLVPAADVRVSATASLFTWKAVPGSSSYRFERRPDGGTTASETVNTVGLAWAPVSKLSDGAWEWRVSTVDAAGKVIATSPWRTFRVDGTAPTVVTTTPTSSALRGTNVSATFSEPVRGVTTGTVKLFQVGRAHPVSATVVQSVDKLKAVLNPAVDLNVGRTYRAVLTSGITDGALNPLVKREWTFTVTG